MGAGARVYEGVIGRDKTAARSPWRITIRLPAMPADPRVLQILFLGVLLAAGAWIRDFELQTAQIALTFAAAIATQGILGRAAKRGPVSYLSPTITALGVTLLLRADNLWAHPAAAAIAISSKFVIRGPRGRHLFNPANFGVVIALASIPGTWVSPGQWGQDVSVAGWIIALGGLVTYRARRGDISWSFLATYMGALAIRVAWLGQRWAVWSHQFDNGALLLFAFFMISDPMTIPSDWRGRLAHAAAVAAIAYVWQFGFYRNDGFIWALFAAAPLVPLWDSIWPAPQYQWNAPSMNNQVSKGVSI